MANLSKQKRERMLGFLAQLKNTMHDDASIRALSEIENSLIDRKYGLVWEEHEENVDVILQDNIPVLCENKDREIICDENLPFNFLIEGDNLHSLHLLRKTHCRKIDCIYIDPPYNNGKKDWKYNNRFIDINDTYMHSKWLSMMSRRLSIAKELLTDNGTLICAIDENELATVILLLEEIFGTQYIIDKIAVIHNPRGIQGDNFSYIHEYALFVYKKGYKVVATREVSEEEIDWSPLRNWGDESERLDAANCFYPIYVKDNKIIGFGDDVTSDDTIHPTKNEFDEETGITSVWPIDNQGIERKWRYARHTVEGIKNLLKVVTSNGILDVRIGKDFAPYKTVWADKKYDSNEYGTQLISSMAENCDFDYPKSLYNVQECIEAVTKNNPDAVILDFFAGSGTTGHAVLEINKKYGGNRKFILCTNNDVGLKKETQYQREYGYIDENSQTWKDFVEKYGIASSVTYPRVRSAIKGFTHKKHFKTILFEKKLTPTVIRNSQRLLETIDQVKAENAALYSEIKLLVEDEYIKLIGIIKKGKPIEGIHANLKYLKCDWTPRRPEDHLLSNILCMHIKEMIELQNAIKIDNIKNVLILNRNDLKETICNPAIYPLIENIWINQNIILNASEMGLLSKKGFQYIPREFYGQELREVAE